MRIRSRRYWSHVDRPVARVFFAGTVLSGIIGFFLLPSSGGPPFISADNSTPTWYFNISPAPIRGTLAIIEAMGACQRGACAGSEIPGKTEMIFSFEAKFTPRVRYVKLYAEIFPVYSPCPSPSIARPTNHECDISADIPVSRLAYSAGPVIPIILLQWSSEVFYSTSGPYASVEIPAIVPPGWLASDKNPAKFSQYFGYGGIEVPWQLSVQTGPEPTFSEPNEWDWNSKSASVFGKSFTLTDDTAAGNATLHGFYSGIALGVAGGALIALMEQLLRPLGNRSDIASRWRKKSRVQIRRRPQIQRKPQSKPNPSWDNRRRKIALRRSNKIR
jgi:hypothetical protein